MPSTQLLTRKLVRQSSGDSMDSSSSSFFKNPLRSKRRAASNRDSNKPSVSFCTAVELIRFDASQSQEKSDIWYSKNDIRNIRKHNAMLVGLEKDGVFVESDDNTFLGLEKYLNQSQIQERRESVYDAVLIEQSRQQRSKKCSDPEKLAKVYRKELQRISSE